jgi:LysM repeat protein
LKLKNSGSKIIHPLIKCKIGLYRNHEKTRFPIDLISNRRIPMKKKVKAESKIPTTQTNTNKKKQEGPARGDKPFESVFFKKNEFALILLGALLLTIIVFFLFFRSGDDTTTADKQVPETNAVAALEKRVEDIENKVNMELKQGQVVSGDEQPAGSPDLNRMEERVARLEAAFALKFDSMIERLDSLEAKVNSIQSRPVAQPVSKPDTTIKKKAVAEKKTTTVKKPDPKSQMFHTVKKGETLYSISKKYNTSVDALRELNNFSKEAKIYPGNNILVR